MPNLESLSSLDMDEVLDLLVFVSNLLAGDPDDPGDDGILVCTVHFWMSGTPHCAVFAVPYMESHLYQSQYIKWNVCK